MVVRKRKKVLKYRGRTTHGGGHRKKRRGAGSRGGRGRAGTGKRAGHKKAGMPPQLGSRGFLPRRTVQTSRTINVGYFTPERVGKLLAAQKVQKEGAAIVVDLTAWGYTKLLATGTVALKLHITVASCSAQAAQKIEAAGGKVTTLNTAK